MGQRGGGKGEGGGGLGFRAELAEGVGDGGGHWGGGVEEEVVSFGLRVGVVLRLQLLISERGRRRWEVIKSRCG